MEKYSGELAIVGFPARHDDRLYKVIQALFDTGKEDNQYPNNEYYFSDFAPKTGPLIRLVRYPDGLSADSGGVSMTWVAEESRTSFTVFSERIWDAGLNFSMTRTHHGYRLELPQMINGSLTIVSDVLRRTRLGWKGVQLAVAPGAIQLVEKMMQLFGWTNVSSSMFASDAEKRRVFISREDVPEMYFYETVAALPQKKTPGIISFYVDGFEAVDRLGGIHNQAGIDFVATPQKSLSGDYWMFDSAAFQFRLQLIPIQ